MSTVKVVYELIVDDIKFDSYIQVTQFPPRDASEVYAVVVCLSVCHKPALCQHC